MCGMISYMCDMTRGTSVYMCDITRLSYSIESPFQQEDSIESLCQQQVESLCLSLSHRHVAVVCVLCVCVLLNVWGVYVCVECLCW